jgi:hypothetical protein
MGFNFELTIMINNGDIFLISPFFWRKNHFLGSFSINNSDFSAANWGFHGVYS